jgi:Pyruvate/2-oxoacid:ferredoxin oxidoreductase gamma subunit
MQRGRHNNLMYHSLNTLLVHDHVVCVNNSFRERLAAGLAIAQLSEAERRKKQEDARSAETAAAAAAAAAADAAAAARSGNSAAVAAAAAAAQRYRGDGTALLSRYLAGAGGQGISVTVAFETSLL